MTTVSYRFTCRRRTAASWTSLNEVLLQSEIGHETDTDKFKFGDGVSVWNSLSYVSSGGGGGGGVTYAQIVAALGYVPADDSDLSGHIANTSNPHAVTKT